MANLNMFFSEEDQVKEGVVFFDMSQLMLASIMNTFQPTDKIEIDMMRHMFLDTVRGNIMRFKKDYPNVVLAVDATKNGYWRRDIAWYYKRNRSKARLESEWDWDTIFGMVNQIIEEFSLHLPRKVISIDKVEADDIIAVLTKELATAGHPVMIVSSDGDYTQLHVHKGVKQWSPMQKKLVKPKHGSPYADLMVKLVKGDKKDCVSPIKCRSSYYADRIEGERAPSVKTTWLKELTDAEDPRTLLDDELTKRFDENVKLIDFNAIPQEIVDSIKDQYYNKQVGTRNGFYSYLVRSKCAKLISKITDF